MSSTKIIGIVIGLAIVGGLVYVGTQKPKEDVTGPRDQTDQTGEVSQGKRTMETLGDLLATTGNWECTWFYDQNGVQNEGTIYISDGKFSTEVDATRGGTTMTMHALSDGQLVYAWTDVAPFGTKFDLSAMKKGEVGASANTQEELFTKENAYNCVPWTLDASLFVPPTTITFMQLPAQQQ